jgi:hypothetical protein
MAVSQPQLLVDVDGVLNVLSLRQPGKGFRRHVVHGFPLWLTLQHGQWLTELGVAFEVVWATTWEHDANTHIAPRIGLAQVLPVIEFRHGRMRSRPAEGIWKRPDVERATQGRALAWLDDDFTAADFDWAARRTATQAPTLLLACDPLVGMTRQHVEEALAWAAELPVTAGKAS